MNYPKILTLGLPLSESHSEIILNNRIYKVLSLDAKSDISLLQKIDYISFMVVYDYTKHCQKVDEILNLFSSLPFLILPNNFSLDKSKKIYNNLLTGMDRTLNILNVQKLKVLDLEKMKGGSAEIYVQFFGNFKVKTPRQESLKLKGNLFTNLTAYLFYYHSQKKHQDKLVQLFWEGFENEAAKRCLRVHIFNIKKQLKEKLKETDPILNEVGFYFFHPNISIQTDVEIFQENYNKAHTFLRKGEKTEAMFFFQKVIELYQGDFMEGFLREDWFVFERKKWKDRYLESLQILASWHFDKQDYRTALAHCQLILEKDNCFELAHRLMIEIYMKLGQRSRAIRQFKTCEKILENELGMNPSSKTIEIYERLNSV